MELQKLVRKNIWEMKPYSCARDEFQGEAEVYLDANENPLGAPCNRYPDPLQREIKALIAPLKGVRPEQIMLGNGSDEPIDLIYRVFCNPGVDNVVAIAPSYGMYEVAAETNDVAYRKVPLDGEFRLHADDVLAATDAHTKAIFLCSPNNPTGNALQRDEVCAVIERFEGIVVVDEAYIDFAPQGTSWLGELDRHPNLVVLQTFSKAWGMAGVRCGMAFASREIIGLFNKVKYPYNVNILTQSKVLERLRAPERKDREVALLLRERDRLIAALGEKPFVKKIYPTDANFVLVEVDDAPMRYRRLVERKIIVRNRHTVVNNCLRITVGTHDEVERLLQEI